MLLQAGNVVEGMGVNNHTTVPTSFSIKDQSEQGNFKDVQVNKTNGKYIVTGKSKLKKGVFYYSVENGHNEVVTEQKVKVNNLNWTSFKLSFSPKEQSPKNGVLLLNLYEKNRSGEVIDNFPIVVDHFKE